MCHADAYMMTQLIPCNVFFLFCMHETRVIQLLITKEEKDSSVFIEEYHSLFVSLLEILVFFLILIDVIIIKN